MKTTTVLDKFLRESARLYGTRNWNGEHIRIAYQGVDYELPEPNGLSFKPTQQVLEHLEWRARHGLDTGPYFQRKPENGAEVDMPDAPSANKKGIME